MLFFNIINRRTNRKVTYCCIIIMCLAAVLFINSIISIAKDTIYNVTVSDNIGNKQKKNHLGNDINHNNLMMRKKFSSNKQYIASSSQIRSTSLTVACSYDLLRHPDAQKLRQMVQSYKKDNETAISCKLKNTKLHPYYTVIKFTALASYPRSGNTWLRTLIEKSTGYQTSSVYCDTSLSSFKAECFQSNLFLMKTHEENTSVAIQNRPKSYDQFIYLVRNPFDAILSYYHYSESEKNVVKKKRNSHESSLDIHTTIPSSSISIPMVEDMISAYYKNFHYWQSTHLPRIDIRYEDLRKSPEIILRYVTMFLVPINVRKYKKYQTGVHSRLSYYFDNPSVFSVTTADMSKYIEQRDKTIVCATEADVLSDDFVYKSNKYTMLHSLKYFSNDTIQHMIQYLLEPLCYFKYDILFKNKLNIPCQR